MRLSLCSSVSALLLLAASQLTLLGSSATVWASPPEGDSGAGGSAGGGGGTGGGTGRADTGFSTGGATWGIGGYSPPPGAQFTPDTHADPGIIDRQQEATPDQTY